MSSRARTKARASARSASAAKAKRIADGRKHGVKGGRPRSKLPADVLARLGPPPSDPIAGAEWLARALHECTWLLMTGKLDVGLAASIRAQLGASLRAVPGEAVAALSRKLAEATDDLEHDPGPQPQPREADAPAPLRRNPR